MSSHLPAYKSKDVLRALAAAGFFVDHVSGSHYILKHAKRGLRVTLPWHGKDLKRGTVTSIIKQAGLTVEEFLKL